METKLSTSFLIRISEGKIMAEITVQFRNKMNGYDKKEVDLFVKDAEAKLQEKAAALANLQQQVSELEARLNKINGGEGTSVEEKVELYDKLMKKMDGDYNNLLAPAIAKAKAIEEQAQKEYEIRMDQARYSAEGVYAETADRIAGVVDANMDRLYSLMGDFIYSKSLIGRIEAFIKTCGVVSKKVVGAVGSAAQVPKAFMEKTFASAKEKVDRAKVALDTYKKRDSAADAED